jgi:hypothetical protein
MSIIFLITASPILSGLFLATYFSPVIVAFFRGNTLIGRIALVNLAFGWTGVGWLVCMFWAWKR